jgi:hypothetical protein
VFPFCSCNLWCSRRYLKPDSWMLTEVDRHLFPVCWYRHLLTWRYSVDKFSNNIYLSEPDDGDDPCPIALCYISNEVHKMFSTPGTSRHPPSMCPPTHLKLLSTAPYHSRTNNATELERLELSIAGSPVVTLFFWMDRSDHRQRLLHQISFAVYAAANCQLNKRRIR